MKKNVTYPDWLRITLHEVLPKFAGTDDFTYFLDKLQSPPGRALNGGEIPFERFTGDDLKTGHVFLRHYLSMPEKKQKKLRKLIAYLYMRTGSTVKEASDLVGMNEDWGIKLLSDIQKKGKEALKPDSRLHNGKEPLYSKPEIITYIAKSLQTPPPNDTRWKARHIQALMEREFGFQEVPIQRAAENLNRAAKINRKNSD